MHLSFRIAGPVVWAVLAAAPPALAALPRLDCAAEVVCLAGGDCTPSGGTVELEPAGDGYRALLEAGEEILLAPMGPPAEGMVHFSIATPEGVAVLISLYQDGRFAMTVQQDVDGPHVETTFGTCKAGG